MQIGKRVKILVIGSISIGLLTLVMATSFIPKIIYNPSASAPAGFYFVRQGIIPEGGDYVLLALPETVKMMAHKRQYVGQDIPLLKQVFAQFGDHICIKYDVVYVNYEAVAEVKSYDPSGRKMPVWKGCRKLEKGELFLLNLYSVYSFDSRYFGPVKQNEIIGVAIPIWVQSDVENFSESKFGVEAR